MTDAVECSYCGASMRFSGKHTSVSTDDTIVIVLTFWTCPDCHRHTVTNRQTYNTEGVLLDSEG